MMAFFADLFGYLLNFLYDIFKNYGLAMIVFSIVIKILFIPISIKQQKTMKKSAKLQEKMKEIQSKYKGDPEKLNQETMNLYKTEKMSPFSGCFSAIIQIVLLLSVFYLVRSPLTHMKKIDPQIIENYTNEMSQSEDQGMAKTYPEIEIIKRYGAENEAVNINMQFLGLDLSSVPTMDLSDFRVYIIPGLYVISSFISMRISMNMQKSKKKDVILNTDGKEEKNELDALASANKSMSWLMPVMSISIAIIAPLGLALYWLVNNILMIGERLILNRFIKDEEEEG